MFERLKNKIIFLVLATLLVTTFFVWQAVLARSAPGKLAVDFFDVGQGDALFLDAGNGNQVLIDGGPSDAILNKLGSALPFSDRKIELLILTHPDADHLDGLIEVLKRYEVGEILETGIIDDPADYQTWNDLIKQKNIPVVLARAGQKIKIADNLKIEILTPFGNISGQDFTGRTNNTSIVGRIVFGQSTILFTGDAEQAEEWQILQSGQNVKSEILQVGHHGSKNSSSPEFLAAVAEQFAVIQVGAKNSYGHPAPETLEKLKGVEIFRTDQNGDIDFLCDLETCQLKNRQNSR